MIKLSEIAENIKQNHMWLKHELWEIWHKMKDDEILERIYRLEELIKEQPKIATDTNVGCKWIPCSERLPEDGENVLITIFNDVLNIGWFEVGNNIWRTDDYDCDDGQVIAWMPLPEAYKEEVNQ